MARPPGATVHMGKAIALIVAVFVLGLIIMREDNFGSTNVSTADLPDDISEITDTTVAPEQNSPTTTEVPALHAKNTVKVIAINASGVAGQASKATTKLQQAGYNAVQPGNAPQKASTALVYWQDPAYELDAREIAALFGLPDSAVRALPNPSPSADIKPDHHIIVLVGPGITL